MVRQCCGRVRPCRVGGIRLQKGSLSVGTQTRCFVVPSMSDDLAAVQALTVASEKIKAARAWADSTLRYLDTTRQVCSARPATSKALRPCLRCLGTARTGYAEAMMRMTSW
jgi:hypothetical protein